MSEEFVISLGGQAIQLIIFLAGPMLVTAMVIGIVVSVLQAITQINEATMTFIPKMMGIIGVLILMAPWMLKKVQEFAIQIFGSAGDWVR